MSISSYYVKIAMFELFSCSISKGLHPLWVDIDNSPYNIVLVSKK
jgi:hypothetical protein